MTTRTCGIVRRNQKDKGPAGILVKPGDSIDPEPELLMDTRYLLQAGHQNNHRDRAMHVFLFPQRPER